jgi:hypothetical protein
MKHEYHERPEEKDFYLFALEYFQNVANFQNSKITTPTATKKPQLHHKFTTKNHHETPKFRRPAQ